MEEAFASIAPKSAVKLVFTGAFEREVALPRSQVKRLRPGELGNALYYEIEPFGALPAAEGIMAFALAPESDNVQAVYRIAQIPRAALDAAIGAAAAKGCKATSAETENGIELWKPAGKAKIKFSAKTLAAAALALAAAAGVFDWRMVSSRLENLRSDVERRSLLQSRLNAELSRARTLQNECESLQNARKEAAAAQHRAAAFRNAVSQFLSSVAMALGERAVVRSIEKTGDNAMSMRVSAVSISAADAARAMTRLDEILTPQGWRVQAEDVSRQAAATRFSCVCTYIGKEAQEQ